MILEVFLFFAMSIVKQPTSTTSLSCMVTNGYGAWSLGEFNDVYERFAGQRYSKVLNVMSIHATNDIFTFAVKATNSITKSDVYMKQERHDVMMAATKLTKGIFSEHDQSTIEKVHDVAANESSFVFITLSGIHKTRNKPVVTLGSAIFSSTIEGGYIYYLTVPNENLINEKNFGPKCKQAKTTCERNGIGTLLLSITKNYVLHIPRHQGCIYWLVQEQLNFGGKWDSMNLFLVVGHPV